MAALSRTVTQLQRQQLQQNIQACFVCGALTLVGPAIAALVVGAEYDASSVCNDNANYTIDLQDFMLAAGGVCIGWICIGSILSLAACLCCSAERQLRVHKVMFTLISCPVMLWCFAWSILGLYIYKYGMSEQCQAEAIGQMILAWSLINVVLVGLGLCSICCMLWAVFM